MSASPPQSPAEYLATLLWSLSQFVASRTGWGRLSLSTIALIVGRIRRIKQRFASLAARIAAGTYRPRRSPASPQRRPGPRPPPEGTLSRKSGWLLELVPEAIGHSAQLEHLLRQPEMVELIAAAPAAMARVLRPLCWMLRVTPPPILASPAKPRPARKSPSAPEAAPPPSQQPPAPPARCKPPRRRRWSLARIRGAPPGCPA